MLNRALEIANSASIGDFVAIEIRQNENMYKAYMITPGSLLFALSEMTCSFKVQDIIAGKLELSVTSNESRTRSRTVITRYRLEHDDLDHILRNIGILAELKS